jgi:RND family efflux transporter MFP subunit
MRQSIFIIALLLTGSAAAVELPFAVAAVERRVMAREQVFDAVIEAVHQATVSAQTAGRILEVNFDVDDYVLKDTVLLRLRDKEQRAAVQAAEAQFAEAKGNFERMQDLLGRKLVSKAEYDRAEAAVKSAKAALAQAQEQLEHTVVRAPYSGIVVKRHVQPGEMANPGQAMMTGLSLEQLRATANVSQAYVDEARERGRAQVLLAPRDPRGETRRLDSTAVTVSPFADAQSHTFRVRVDLPSGQHGVYPGMFTKVAIVTGEESRLLVPAAAVVHRSEVTGVYVADGEGRVTFRQVRIGDVRDGMVEVLAGLSEGERVALDPIRAGVYLKDLRAGNGA